MRIETSRLLVRNLRPTDGDALYAVLSDSEVMRYVEPPFSAEQTRTFLQAAGLCEPPLVYAVVWKQTGELIGHLIWHPWDETGMELGWILRRDFWGRGIAAELTAALLARTDRDVILECSPDQRVTQHIAETFGFSRIGQQKGVTLVTKKSIESKEIIRKHSKDFNGSLSDVELIQLTGLARGTYYKYKRELKGE